MVFLLSNIYLQRVMAAAASGRLAATAARHGAAAAALRALLDAVPDGATRAAARLLLGELAAALGVEPMRQTHHGGGGAAVLSRTRRRREQRRAALARLRSSGAAHGDGVVDGCKRGNKDKMAKEGVEGAWFQDQRPAAGERRAAGNAAAEPTGSGADRDVGARELISDDGAESAGGRRRQQRPGHGRAQEQGQAATAAASTEPAEARAMEHDEQDERLPCAEPRVAAAAEPHKRRAVRRQWPLEPLERAGSSLEGRPRSRTTCRRDVAGGSSGAGRALCGGGSRRMSEAAGTGCERRV